MFCKFYDFHLLKEHSFRHWFVFYLEDKFQTVDETKSNTTQFINGISYAQGSIGPILMLMLMLMTCTAHVSNTAAHGAWKEFFNSFQNK